MKYISLDIETTGLYTDIDKILEVGAIIEDTNLKLPRIQCPTFHIYIDRERVFGDIFALSLNAHILKKILELRKTEDRALVKEDVVVTQFMEFLKDNGIEKVTFAGKNFMGFDLQFLKKLPDFHLVKYHYRALDPAVLFTDFVNDTCLPDLSVCKARAGFANTMVTHEALDDAWDVIELLRTQY
jgi:oligoribonuclease (3'-5' exoribonuclease)